VVEGNLLENNGISGVTLHSHAPGAFIGGNVIEHNIIGVNNLTATRRSRRRRARRRTGPVPGRHADDRVLVCRW